MRLILWVILLSFFFHSAEAQRRKKPAWLDPYQRQIDFPKDKFLIGLTSESVRKKKGLSEAYQKLNQLSRNQLIEGIRVQVKAETEMNISIVNTEVSELLNQNSSSKSEAEIVGLKVENYYHKRKKLAYSLSYVSISQLLAYHENVIRNGKNILGVKIPEAKNALLDSNKEKVISLLYESQVALNSIDLSVRLISALDVDQTPNLNNIRALKDEVKGLTEQVLTEGSLNSLQLADYLAYQLKLQIEDREVLVGLGDVPYLGTTKESSFTQTLKNQVINRLAAFDKVTITDGVSELKLEGDVRLENEVSFTTLRLIDQQNQVLAGVSLNIAQSVLSLGDLNYLPTNFEYLGSVSEIKLTPDQPSYSVKKVDLFERPLTTTVSYAGELLSDIPLNVILKKGGSILWEKVMMSDQYGKVILLLNKEELKGSGDYTLESRVDVPSLFDLPVQSEFIKTSLRDDPPYGLKISVSVTAPNVLVVSEEKSFGAIKEIAVLASAVKKELALLDYQFVDDLQKADFVIRISAVTKEGQKTGAAYFSYLDATISMQDLKTNREVYKYALTNVKGAGRSFDIADGKAYENAKELIGKDLAYKLEFENQ